MSSTDVTSASLIERLEWIENLYQEHTYTHTHTHTQTHTHTKVGMSPRRLIGFLFSLSVTGYTQHHNTHTHTHTNTHIAHACVCKL